MERHRKGGDVGIAFLPEIRPRRQVFLALQRISDPAECPWQFAPSRPAR